MWWCGDPGGGDGWRRACSLSPSVTVFLTSLPCCAYAPERGSAAATCTGLRQEPSLPLFPHHLPYHLHLPYTPLPLLSLPCHHSIVACAFSQLGQVSHTFPTGTLPLYSMSHSFLILSACWNPHSIKQKAVVGGCPPASLSRQGLGPGRGSLGTTTPTPTCQASVPACLHFCALH